MTFAFSSYKSERLLAVDISLYALSNRSLVRFAVFVGSVFSMVDISYDFALRIYEEFGGLRGSGVVG